MELGVLFGTFFVLLAIGTPVAFCLGFSALATLIVMDISPVIAFQRMISGINVFALLALPFFIFAGELMTRGGIATRLLEFAEAAVGHIRGGLGIVNVSSSLAFGGISGSAVADVSALGSTLIPMMEKRGFHRDFSVNVTTSSAILGLLIPPSHNMIIYAVAAGGSVSIASLFVGGLLPGVVAGLCLMGVVYVISVRRAYPREPFPGWAALVRALVLSLPGLMTAIIILGGVLSGVFTATESAAIAVFWAVGVSVLVYRSLSWTGFREAARASLQTTAMVMIVIGAAAAFGWVLAVNEVPVRLAELVAPLVDDPILLLLLINVILLLLGAIMDMAPLIMIMTPILLPVAEQTGMDPVQFGIMMILNLGIGLITPPVGAVLFVGSAIGRVELEATIRSMWPFYLALLIALGCITFVPAVSLWLPGVFGQ